MFSFIGEITKPPQITWSIGAVGIGQFITRAIEVALTLGALILLFMIILSGYQWLTSGGDKEAVAKARARITTSITGIVIMFLAYLIVNTIGQVLKFNLN